MSSPVVSTVTFRRPVQLPGMETRHNAGTFELVSDQHELDVSWPAYHVTMMIKLPVGAATEAYVVTRADLEAALSADAAEPSP
jgi:hypothetical protein